MGWACRKGSPHGGTAAASPPARPRIPRTPARHRNRGTGTRPERAITSCTAVIRLPLHPERTARNRARRALKWQIHPGPLEHLAQLLVAAQRAAFRGVEYSPQHPNSSFVSSANSKHSPRTSQRSRTATSPPPTTRPYPGTTCPRRTGGKAPSRSRRVSRCLHRQRGPPSPPPPARPSSSRPFP